MINVGKFILGNCDSNNVHFYSPITGNLLESAHLPEVFSYDTRLLQNLFGWHSKNCSLEDKMDFCIGDSNGEIFFKKWEGSFVKFEKFHTKQIISLNAHRDKLLLSGSRDKSICLWDLYKKQLIWKFNKCHKSTTSSVLFLNNNLFSSGSDDKTVKIFDFLKLKEIQSFDEHGGFVNSLSFDKEKKVIVSASHDKVIKLWSFNESISIGQAKCDNPLNAVLYQENYLYSGDTEGYLYCFDYRNLNKRIFKERIHQDQIYRIIKYDESTVITGSRDMFIKKINCRDGKELLYIQGKCKVFGPFILSNVENWNNSVVSVKEVVNELGSENIELKRRNTELNKEKSFLINALNMITKRLSLKEKDISYKYKQIIFKTNRDGHPLVLGSGAFGNVYKVEYNKIKCAFKKLDDKLLKDPEKNENVFRNLEKEVLPMCITEHPNILKTIGYSKYIEYDGLKIKDNRVGILTELGKCDIGKLIFHSKKSRCDIRPELKLFLLYSVSNAMKFLHSPEVSIMHRDLKWENVLILAESGRCVLCDFGLSKVFQQNRNDTNTLGRGTSWFIAPEIVVAEERDQKIRYNQKCDVFSFSIMMCQLLFSLDAPSLGKYFYSRVEDFRFNPKIRPQIDKIPNFFNKNKKRELDTEVIRVMEKCWSETPSERPSFDDLTTFFRKKLEMTENGLELLEDEKGSKKFLEFYHELKEKLKN